MSRFWREGAFFIVFSVVSVGGCEEEEATKATPARQYCRPLGKWLGKINMQVILELPCSRIASWIKEGGYVNINTEHNRVMTRDNG